MTFGSVSAPIVGSSATNIQTSVPVGAITAPITVVTPNGTISSAQSFVILDGSGTATVQNGIAPYAGRNIFPRNASNQTLQVVYSPPAAGTVEGIQIAVPSEFGAPAASNVVVAGAGGSPGISVAGQTITITNLAATTAFTNSIARLSMPDTATSLSNSGNYTVNIQSRGVGGTFAAIAAPPSALVTVPLANVRNYNTNYTPFLSNALVAVEGVASVAKLQNRGISSAIQDATWGVALDAATNVVISNLVRGNTYAAIGRISQFLGTVQISITNSADILNLGTAVDPVPVVATVSQFTNTNTAPSFQSRVVRIENLSGPVATWATNTSVVLTNTAGEQVTVFIPFGSTATNPPTFPVAVTGLGGQSDNAAPFDTGWRIQPRDAADLASVASPVITTNGAALTALTTTYGQPSSSTSFAVAGTNMTAGILVTPPTGFEVSTNDSTFSSNVTVGAAGTISNTTIFARLASNAPVAGSPYSGNIVLSSSGAASANVSTAPSTVSAKQLTISNVNANSRVYDGTTNATLNTASATLVGVIPPDTNNVTLQTGSATGAFTDPNVGTGKPVTASGFAITGTASGNYSLTQPTGLTANITQATPTILTAPTASAIFQGQTLASSTLAGGSASPAGSFAWSNTNTVPPLGTSSQPVIFTPTDGVNFTTATTNVSVTVNAVGTPVLNPPNNISLSVPATTRGTPSAATNVTVNGTNLSAPITITPPPGWQISPTNTNSFTSSALVFATNPAGVVSNFTLNIRLAGTNTIATNYVNSAMTLISGTNTNTVLLSGSVTNPPPVLTVSTNALTGFAATRPNASTNQSFTVEGTNLTANVVITPPGGWQISTNSATNTFTNPNITLPINPAGVLSNTAIFVRLAGTNASTTNYVDNSLSVVSGATNTSVLLSGTVTVPPPSLSLSTNALSGFTTTTNIASTNQTFAVTGTNLIANVTVTPTNGWQVATNTNSFSGTAITLPVNAGGGVSNDVFLRIGPVASATNFVGTPIVVASGSTNRTLSASGQVNVPAGVPSISSFTPTNGPRGTMVTINGSNLGTTLSNGVSFGGVASKNVTVDGPGQVRAVVPLAAPTGRIVLSNTAGVSTSSLNFTIDSLSLRIPPTIGAGVPTPARVSITNTAPSDVVVTLSSSAAPTISVPATVTIPAGQNYVVFPVTTTLVGAPIGGTISAIADDYLGTAATTTVTPTFTRAASLMDEGYRQDFASFTNFRTLPFGWTNIPAITSNNSSAWGTSNIGLKFSTETLKVFGVQHLATSTATNSQILTLRNDTGTNLTQIRVTYTARTTNAFANIDRFPAYTVTVAAAVGTNTVNFTTNVANLSYSTGQGDNFLVSGTLALAGTNPLLANGIPAWTNFTITWASDAGDGSENSAQIGIGDLFVEPAKPYVQLTPVAGVSDLITVQGTASAPRAFWASGQDLQGQGVLSIVAPTNFQVSTNDSAGFANQISLAASNGTVSPVLVWARIRADAPQAPPPSAPTTVSGELQARSTNATTASQIISGVVFASGGANQVLASPEALTNFSSVLPAASANQTFFVSGANLLNSITVNATAGWQVSTNTNSFSTGLVIPLGRSNQVAPTPVYVRLAPNQAAGVKTGTVSVASGSATDTVQLGGTVNTPPPSIVLNGNLTAFSTTRGVASAVQTFTVSGSSLVEPLVLSAPEGYEISNGGSIYTDTVSLAPSGGTVATTTISVRIADYAPASNPLAGNLTASSAGAITRLLPLTGTVTANANAWISARPASLTNFITISNRPSDAQVFTVQAANINTNLSVSVTDRYEISKNGIDFTNVVTLARVTNGTGGGGGGTTVIASDSGSNYPPSGPVTGTNLGTGFGPWTISTGTSATGSAGIFVGNPTAAGIGGMATNSFGLYANANPPTNADFVTASRALLAPLGVGESFSFEWGNNYDSGAVGNKGVNLTTAGGSSNVFSLNMGGSAAITLGQGTNAAVEVQPGSAYGTNVMTFTFARTAFNSFTVSAPAGRNLGPGFTNTFTVTNEVTGFAFYASGLQNDGNPTNRDSAQPYFNNLQVTAPTSGDPGDVALTTLFVRLKAQTGSPGSANGTITASGAPATPRTIALIGRVPQAPIITVNPASLSDFRATNGTASAAKSFAVSAQTLAGPLSIVAPANFQVSLSNSTAFTNQLSLNATGENIAETPIFVRVASTAPAGDYTNSNVQLFAIGFLAQTATNSVQLSATVYTNNGAPQLSLPVPTALSGFSTIAGTPSPSQSFIVSGINLTTPVTATVTAPYEVSTNDITFSSSATSTAPAPSPGSVEGARFFVRVAASASGGSPSGTATLSALGAANRTVSLNSVVAPTPALTVSPNALTNFESVAEFVSPAQSFILSGTNIAPAGTGFAPVAINVTGPFQVSLNNADWAAATNYTPGAAVFSNVPVYVRVVSDSVPGNISGAVGFSGQGITNAGAITVPSVALSGRTLPRPVINVAPSTLGQFNTPAGTPSAARSFAVGGSNLLGNISVAAPLSYEISTNNGVSWTNSISLEPAFQPPSPGTPPVVVASDNAGNYGGGWNNGSSGGSGFGPWTIVVNTNAGGFAGNFIGDPSSAGITGMSAQSFGLYANPPTSGASVSAARSLLAVLQTNQTFSFQWAVNFDTGSTNYKGFRLFAGATQLLEVGQNGFPGDLRLIAGASTNTNLGIAYGTGPMTWSFAMTNANTLRVTSSPRDGSTNVAFTTNLTVTAAPDSFVWFAGAMNSVEFADQRQPYFNNLRVTAPAAGTAGVVTNTTVLVRLKSSAGVGTANQNVNATSDPYALPKTVALTGEVFPVPGQPGVSLSPNSLFFRGVAGGASPAAGSAALTGVGLGSAVNLSISGPFEFSLDGGATYQTSQASVPTSGGALGTRLFVRFNGSSSSPAIFNGNLRATSGAFSAEVSLIATIFGTGVNLIADPGGLTGFQTREGTPSSSQSFFAMGQNLVGPVTVTLVNDFFDVTTNPSDASSWSNQLVLTPSGGVLSPTPIYVRIGAVSAFGNVSGSVNLADTSSNQAQVALSGFIERLQPPDVRMVKPDQDAAFTRIDPGVSYEMLATASATAVDGKGNPVAIAKVEFLVDGVVVGEDTTKPYALPYTFVFEGNFDVTARATDGLGNVGVSGVAKVQVRPPFPGELVESFVPPAANGNVWALGGDASGRVYLGGEFTELTSADDRVYPEPRLARLTPTGTVDTTFKTGAGPNARVRSILVVADGVIVGGDFTQVNGASRVALAKVTAGGSVDAAFNATIAASATANPSYVQAIVRQPDGKILIGGLFSTVGGAARANLARLNADGTLDTGFNAPVEGAVNTIALQSDGKILIGGSFSAVHSAVSQRIARLNADGTRDTTFNVGSGFGSTVQSIAVTPLGKIYVAGEFTSYQSNSWCRYLAQLNQSGNIVTSFNYIPGLDFPASRALGVPGTEDVLVAGRFTSVGNSALWAGSRAVGRIVRFKSDGVISTEFNPGQPGANGAVNDAVQMPGGGWLIAGSFTKFNNVNRSGLALLAGPQKITSYASWAAKWGLSDAQAHPAAKLNAAGVPNLLVYALSGNDPRSAQSDLAALPKIGARIFGSSGLSLAMTRNTEAKDVLFLGEYSEDLKTWFTNGVVTEFLPDKTILLQAPPQSMPSGHQFLRLKVVLP